MYYKNKKERKGDRFMGNDAYFMSFKDKKKETVMEAINRIGKENFWAIDIQGLATFKKNFYPCNIKKGETYLMTYGDRYVQRDKEFLEGVEGITKRNCRMILGENVYWALDKYSDLENYADIENVEYDGDKYVIFEETEEDKKWKEKYNIRRFVGGYKVPLKTMNSNECDESGNALSSSFEDGAYYMIKKDLIDSNDEITVSSFKRSFNNSKVYIFNVTNKKGGFLDFTEVLDGYELEENVYSKSYEESDENIELALRSVARAFGDKKNIQMTYVKGYTPKEFRELAKTQFPLGEE